MSRTLRGRPVVAGEAAGAALTSRLPISFWGGLDPRTGRIADRRHDRCGELVTGRVFVFPHEKGSSTGSAILLESIRRGTAPAALLTAAVCPVVALGSVVADVLWGRCVPMVVLDAADLEAIADGQAVHVAPDGTVTLGDAPPV